LKNATIKKLDRELDAKRKEFEIYKINHVLKQANSTSMTQPAIRSQGAYKGASYSRSMQSWFTQNLDADSELLPDLQKLRERSHDLYRNNSIAAGAIKTTVTNVIGAGLKLQSTIDSAAIGISEEDADIIQDKIEKEFEAWASSSECDASRRLDFYEHQDLAFKTFLLSGESVTTLPMISRPGSKYNLKLNAIDPTRLSQPFGEIERNNFAGGIETGEYGEPVAYHVEKNINNLNYSIREWARIPAFGEKSGRPNVIHLFKAERSGQRRGIPWMSSVIEPLKMIGRYKESELMAAVVSSMFTVFVKNNPENLEGSGGYPIPAQAGQREGINLNLAPGMVHELEENQDISIANPGRPNSQFDPFVTAIMREIGMALELPLEFLQKHFQSSYSAARGAIIEAWNMFRVRQDWFGRKYCQPIYQEWLIEAVASGILFLPRFWESDSIRQAYFGSVWNAPSPGQLDPEKEVMAAAKRCQFGFSNYTKESAMMNGTDWDTNVKRLKKENKKMADAGMSPFLPGMTVTTPIQDVS